MGYGDHSKFIDSSAQVFDVLMRPVIDGKMIEECPTYTINKFNTMGNAPPLLIGNVANEGMYWLLYGLRLKGVQFLNPNGTVNLPQIDQLNTTDCNYQELIDSQFVSTGYLANGITTNIKKTYQLNDHAHINSETFMQKFDKLDGDMDFVCSTKLFASLVANFTSSSVWFYEFMHRSKYSTFPSWTGTMHGYEIEYAFGMPLSAEFRRKYYSFTDYEMKLSKRVMTYFANFARTG